MSLIAQLLRARGALDAYWCGPCSVPPRGEVTASHSIAYLILSSLGRASFVP